MEALHPSENHFEFYLETICSNCGFVHIPTKKVIVQMEVPSGSGDDMDQWTAWASFECPKCTNTVRSELPEIGWWGRLLHAGGGFEPMIQGIDESDIVRFVEELTATEDVISATKVDLET